MTEPSAVAVARDTAVQLVDGLYGYTMEFAPSPAEHRQMYKMAEDAIARALDAFAREREAAVVREAHPYLRHQDTCGYWSNPNAMSDYKCTCGLVQFRARAAEARKMP
jgi:hypothetical protein